MDYKKCMIGAAKSIYFLWNSGLRKYILRLFFCFWNFGLANFLVLGCLWYIIWKNLLNSDIINKLLGIGLFGCQSNKNHIPNYCCFTCRSIVGGFGFYIFSIWVKSCIGILRRNGKCSKFLCLWVVFWIFENLLNFLFFFKSIFFSKIKRIFTQNHLKTRNCYFYLILSAISQPNRNILLYFCLIDFKKFSINIWFLFIL